MNLVKEDMEPEINCSNDRRVDAMSGRVTHEKNQRGLPALTNSLSNLLDRSHYWRI